MSMPPDHVPVALEHPLIFKHPILAELDAMSRHDYQAFVRVRDAIEHGASGAELMRPFIEAHLENRAGADNLLRQFGERVGLESLLRAVLEAMHQVGPFGPHLSSWIVAGGSETFEPAVARTPSTVHLLLLIPRLRCEWLHSKLRENYDLHTPRFLQDLLDDIQRMLDHLGLMR